MPVTYNDGLDDQLAVDACLSFVGGQVSNVRGNLLSQVQYSEGTNVDIDRFGGVVTRHGTKRELGGLLDVLWEDAATNWESFDDLWEGNPTTKIDGLAYFDTPSLEQLVAVNEQKIYKNPNGSWSEVTGYTPASGANVEMTQLVDKLYLTDGTNNVRSFDGTSFTDEGTGTDNPPICKYLTAHTNRLFAAGTSTPDALFASDLLDGSTWDIVNFQIRIGGASGDPITGIVPWMGQTLVVFKARSCFAVTTDPAASTASGWTVNNIDTNVGCVSNRSIAQVGQDIFFLAPDGIRTVRSILEGASTAVSEPISVGIQDVIDTINWNAAREQACAAFWRNHYLLAVPTLSSQENNKLIVYNTVAKAFVGVWTLSVTQFASSAFTGDLKLALSTEDGKVLFLQDYVQPDNETNATFQDDGVDYESDLLTRSMTFGEQFSEILPNHVEVEMKPALAQQVQIRSVLDEGEDVTINQTHIDTQTGIVTLPFVLPVTFPKTVPLKNTFNMIQGGPAREVQFRVKSFGSKMHLRSVKASAYINTFNQEA